jgi:FtsP/CotA-like multicopper oxidase with cupredoxin domain
MIARLVLALALVTLPAADGTVGADRIVANTNQSPAGRLRNGVLTVSLELRTGTLRPQADDGPGIEVQAFAEPGGPLRIPGPLIRVPEGTLIRATIRNTLADSTLVLHGLHTRPAAVDDTVQVAPGATREVSFTAGAPGTYFYWGTTTGKAMDDDRWIDSQLSGALIVDPAGVRPPANERVFVLGLYLRPGDRAAGRPQHELMLINGKSWPDTERLDYTVGDTVRWRWVNATASSHPMHLHGFYYDVDTRGTAAADTTYDVAHRRRVVTELMLPGGTMAVQWAPSQPGNWVFHCHFAFHVSNELHLAPHPAPDTAQRGHAAAHAMAGLVLGVRVHPAVAAPTPPQSTASAPASPASASAPQVYRLVVRPVLSAPDSAHLMRYALEEARDGAFDGPGIPGPLLTLERGRPVRITVVNRLDQPTSVHWHGIELESYPDGVPGWSGTSGRLFQGIAPGDSFIAAFTPPRAGTFMYHAHANELVQILGGLYGPLLVLPPGEPFDTATNRLVMVGSLFRHDSLFGVVNGHLDPAPIELRVGRSYRLRLFNIGDARTYFALRRPDSSLVAWRALAKDGADLPPALAVPATGPLLTGPGEVADFEFTPERQGELVLEVDSPFAGWRQAVPVHIRAPS